MRTDPTAVSPSIAPPPAAPRGLKLWGALGFLLVIAAQIFGWLISPPDRDMGNLQKIMYVHVPAAMTAFMAFAVVFCASVWYLWKGDDRGDLLASSAAEVGAVLTALTLMLGSIWARPTWGVWWTWDARLTSTAVLLVIFVGYLALRAFTEDPDQRAKWSAAVGILGSLNVPIVMLSVRWWRTIHQLPDTTTSVSAIYRLALWTNVVCVMVLVSYFVIRRYHVARLDYYIAQAAEREALGTLPAELEEAHV